MSKPLEEDSISLEVWELSGSLDFSWQKYLITQTYFLFFPILISYLPFGNLMDELLEEMHYAGQVKSSSYIMYHMGTLIASVFQSYVH